MDQTLLEYILQDTFVKTLALKKVTGLKDYLLNKAFSSSGQGPPETNMTDDPEITTWILSLNPALFSGINQQNIYSIFDQLEKDIKTIEPLVLYLPYELPQEQLTEIGQQLRDSYGSSFLIDIQIDPGLVAGAALSYKGIYQDYSVKQSIFDNKQAILATFKKYIKH